MTVDAHAPLESLMPLFDQGLVVIVRESEHFQAFADASEFHALFRGFVERNQRRAIPVA